MSLDAQARSRTLHRALVRFPLDRRSGAAGLAIAVVVIASIFAFANTIWKGEAVALEGLLRMSDTPYSIDPPPNPAPGLLGGTVKGGATFRVRGDASRVPVAAGLAGIAAFLLASAFAVRSSRVPVPAKVMFLLFAAIGISTLWYTTFVSGSPPNPVDSLTIGFQRGGLLAVMVATLLFAFEVFPVPGPIRIKAGWLAGLILFSLAWSVVRMAVVLATVHHVGSWTFLYLQYLAGPVVDFLSVVAFYSLATHGLARRLPLREAIPR